MVLRRRREGAMRSPEAKSCSNGIRQTEWTPAPRKASTKSISTIGTSPGPPVMTAIVRAAIAETAVAARVPAQS